jgi:hypothetical protein
MSDRFKKVLLRIEPADYELVQTLAKAANLDASTMIRHWITVCAAMKTIELKRMELAIEINKEAEMLKEINNANIR